MFKRLGREKAAERAAEFLHDHRAGFLEQARTRIGDDPSQIALFLHAFQIACLNHTAATRSYPDPTRILLEDVANLVASGPDEAGVREVLALASAAGMDIEDLKRFLAAKLVNDLAQLPKAFQDWWAGQWRMMQYQTYLVAAFLAEDTELVAKTLSEFPDLESQERPAE